MHISSLLSLPKDIAALMIDALKFESKNKFMAETVHDYNSKNWKMNAFTLNFLSRNTHIVF